MRRARLAQLRRVCRAYLQQADALTYRELCTNQDAPWASIAFGAAGIATAQWRSRHSAASARRWLTAAARAARARGAFWSPTLGNETAGPSIYYGADGLRFLRLLLASPGVAADRRALRTFLARCRRCRGGPSELLQGVAGYLTALVTLYQHNREPHVLEVADELAHDLVQRASGRRGWARAARLAFAHGRAGTFHALLTWSLACGRELPAEVFDELARLADDVQRGGTMGASSPSTWRQRSWCNGAAGLALLWARAYEHTPEATYLEQARNAARFTLTHIDGAPGDLCCGLAGRAYALLAMDRIAPGRGWLEHARTMASHATTVMLDACGPWPNGLYKGYPGLVCLAGDLSNKPAKRAGFPLVEG